MCANQAVCGHARSSRPTTYTQYPWKDCRFALDAMGLGMASFSHYSAVYRNENATYSLIPIEILVCASSSAAWLVKSKIILSFINIK